MGVRRIYYHPHFLRGQRDLVVNVQRVPSSQLQLTAVELRDYTMSDESQNSDTERIRNRGRGESMLGQNASKLLSKSSKMLANNKLRAFSSQRARGTDSRVKSFNSRFHDRERSMGRSGSSVLREYEQRVDDEEVDYNAYEMETHALVRGSAARDRARGRGRGKDARMLRGGRGSRGRLGSKKSSRGGGGAARSTGRQQKSPYLAEEVEEYENADEEEYEEEEEEEDMYARSSKGGRVEPLSGKRKDKMSTSRKGRGGRGRRRGESVRNEGEEEEDYEEEEQDSSRRTTASDPRRNPTVPSIEVIDLSKPATKRVFLDLTKKSAMDSDDLEIPATPAENKASEECERNDGSRSSRPKCSRVGSNYQAKVPNLAKLVRVSDEARSLAEKEKGDYLVWSPEWEDLKRVAASSTTASNVRTEASAGDIVLVTLPQITSAPADADGGKEITTEDSIPRKKTNLGLAKLHSYRLGVVCWVSPAPLPLPSPSPEAGKGASKSKDRSRKRKREKDSGDNGLKDAAVVPPRTCTVYDGFEVRFSHIFIAMFYFSLCFYYCISNHRG